MKIPSDLTCPSCTISVGKEGWLEFDGDFSGAPPTWLSRGPTGIYYLVDPAEGTVKSFGSDGRFIRQIGRRGAGPGEYEMIRNVLAAADGTLHVLDGALARHSRYAQDGKFLGSSPLPFTGGLGLPARLLSNGELVVNTRLTGASVGSAVLMRVDRQGKVIASADDADLELRRTWLQRRIIWPRDDGFLSGRPYAFLIDWFDATLRKRATYQRVADWIPSSVPVGQPSDGLFDKPYSPQLWSFWLDEQGLCWVIMLVGAKEWKPGPPMRRDKLPEGAELQSLANRPRIESIVEVLDLRSGKVVARSRCAVRWALL